MRVTSTDDDVQAVVDLLRAADATAWTPAAPTVEKYWDVTQQERGPGADQPGELYVWSPTTSSIEQFTRDGTRFDATATVEVQAWSLDETTARQYRDDATRILGSYIDDNRIRTPYSTVRPDSQDDFREQKPARKTGHYVLSVTVDARGLEATQDVDDTTFDTTFDAGFA